MFFNKLKYQMYKLLTKFNNCKSLDETKQYICQKFKIDNDNDFNFIVSQCIDFGFIDGISYSNSISNHIHIIIRDNIFITYNGYEFLKNYHTFIKKILWNLFLIIATAIITVKVNDYFSKTNQVSNVRNQIISNNPICIKICKNTKQ